MNQPRGVGLMHTRHTPSATYYTHVRVGQRKSENGPKLAETGKNNSRRHVS